MTVVGESAFGYNATAKTVTMSSVTSIGVRAFQYCSALETVVLNEGLVTIPAQAYQSCTSLTSINIPASVTTIEGSAFSGCDSLASVTLTDNVTSIGAYGAFPQDTRVYVPTPDGNAAKALSNAYQNSHTYYVIGDDSFGLRCSNDGVVTLYTFTGSEENVVIPNYVTVVGESAFGYNATAKTVTMSSVTSIGVRAFQYCSALETATLNEGLTSIGTQAFSGCSSLANINLPDSVTSIVNSAFESSTNLRISAGCGSYGASWAANSGYTEVEASAPTGGKQLVLLHDWSVQYEWNSTHTQVTASRACVRDTEQDHVETETVSATSAVTTQPTCTVMGKTTYTSAAFDNPVFTVQAVTLEDIAALGHIWNAPTYAWNGNTQVIATRTCQRADHPETETVSATGEITTPATCTVMGQTTYTSANFVNAAFAVQTKTETDIPALGHLWNAPT